MNKAIVVIASVATSLVFQASAAQAQAVKPAAGTKAFEFKGITAGADVTSTNWDCRPEKADQTRLCHPADWSWEVYPPPQISGVSVLNPTFGFYQNKLSYVGFTILRVELPKLVDALTEKYGRPCSEITETWQNKRGATFPNLIRTWCFATGNLIVKSLGETLDISTFDYFDINSPSMPKAKVDF